jgi:hypothetical protein
MLTIYFEHPFTLRKLRSGPAGPYLDDFAAQLAQAGYSRDKIRAHLRGAGRFSGWAAQAGLAIEGLDARALAQFGRRLDAQGRLRCRRGNTATPLSGLAIWLTGCKPGVSSRRPPWRANRNC